MADLRAMASGLESKSMGSGTGGAMPVWSACEWVKVGRSAGRRGGVMGDIGGRVGDGERGGLSVEMVREGMVMAREVRNEVKRGVVWEFLWY
mgnify:CR=1 FL=1